MSIRPKYGKRSVLQVLSDGMSQPPARFTRDDLPGFRSLLNAFTDDDPDTASYSQRLGVSRVMDAVVDHLNERGGVPAEKLHPEMAMTITAFPSDEDGPTMEDRIKEALSRTDFSFAKGGTVQRKSCCEEAALNAAEVDRLTRERDEWESKYGDMRDDRNIADVELHDAESAREDLEHERDELQRRLDAAEKPEKSEPGWPEWLGPKVYPDDFEMHRTEDGLVVNEDGQIFAHEDDPAWKVRDQFHSAVEYAAQLKAAERFIESKQAVTDDEEKRVEEQAKALYCTLNPGRPMAWRQLAEDERENCRAAIRAGAWELLALADAIEAEEDERDDDQAERLYLSTQDDELGVAWESLTEPMQNGFRAAIRAGWGKEDDK